MSAASPVLSPAFAAHDFEEFSYLSDHSAMDGYSASSDAAYGDENEINLPVKHCSFTPTRLKPQPRAWERKPSTPFAPRSEAQKIWKRVPLQNVTSSINATWRKDNTRGDGIMRPVKRLRVGRWEEWENKENLEYVAAKWDADASPGHSPRRRAPAIHQDSIEKPSSPASAKDKAAMMYALSNILPKVVDPSKPPKTVTRNDGGSAEEAMHVESGIVSESWQQVQRQSQPDESDDNRAAAEQLLDEADVFLRISPETSPTTSAESKQPFSISPPPPRSIHVQDRMSPELGSPQSLRDSQSPIATPVSEPETDTLLQHQQVPTAAPNDPDDTSYLQDFLLRSRAQRAARLQPPQPLTEESKVSTTMPTSVERDSEASQSSSSMSTFEAESAPSPPTMSNIETDADADSETEAKASSPCRRSSRLTRLPRPQKPSTTLPNSIALRRLNGTEFISMQREAQSLAVTTRNNTRKNKGPALTVSARLLQLHSETLPSMEEHEESRKTGKTVSWAETLARFQDMNGMEPSPTPEVEVQSHPPQAAEEVQEVTVEPEQKKASKRVRKLRKESVGSVNGTPAPKRSIEILLEEAARTSGHLAIAHASGGKRTRSRTKT